MALRKNFDFMNETPKAEENEKGVHIDRNLEPTSGLNKMVNGAS